MKRVIFFLAAAALPLVPLLACKGEGASAEQAPAGGKGGRGGMMRGDASGLSFAVAFVLGAVSLLAARVTRLERA